MEAVVPPQNIKTNFKGVIEMSSLIPWFNRTPSPVTENSISEFKKEVDALFNNFFGSKWASPLSTDFKDFSPAFDVKETEEEILVTAELPGVEQSDIEISLMGNILVVKGEKKEEREEKGENRHTIERAYGSFSRSLTIPCDILEEKVEATFSNGVLQLKLPKAQHEKKSMRKIEIKQG